MGPAKMSFTSFICLASLLFISAAYGCDCSGAILEDGNTGGNIGECLTQHRGEYWCYVNPNSNCPDKSLSSRSRGPLKLYYSKAACSIRADYQVEAEPAMITPDRPEYEYYDCISINKVNSRKLIYR